MGMKILMLLTLVIIVTLTIVGVYRALNGT